MQDGLHQRGYTLPGTNAGAEVGCLKGVRYHFYKRRFEYFPDLPGGLSSAHFAGTDQNLAHGKRTCKKAVLSLKNIPSRPPETLKMNIWAGAGIRRQMGSLFFRGNALSTLAHDTDCHSSPFARGPRPARER